MKKSFFRRFASPLSLSLLALLPAVNGAWAAKPTDKKVDKPAVDPALFSTVKWREVGPYRGGRSAAVTGLPGDRNTYYFGGTGGGVWKTTDAGRTWRNVSDGFYGGSIGAVAVSEADPNVVYVGGGEKTVRGNVSHGDGMWKSTDAGKTWKHIGLADSRHIPRVRIHPRDPDLVYAAVLGHLFGPNEMRGVYRSKNGGTSWERVLFVSDRAGAVDLAMDPTNPRILYATTWNVRRTPHSLESGGPGSGIWKSTDGGDTWTELTRNPGLPKGTVGISGITVSPTNPENLYAIVEAEDGGVFRSRDGGRTWTETNDERGLRQRAWYYTRIYADTKDEEAVYVLNVQFHRSKDGGKSFTTIRVPHGDNHDLWIDPSDPLRMIESNDGGANVSTDGGSTWSPQTNQPTAQFYRVSTDTHFPYRILGAQQDNSAVRILSRGGGPGIGTDDWQETAGGESGHIVADPTDPDVVYGGSYGGLLTRVNHDTGEIRDVNPWPNDPMGAGAADLTYRFQWNFPIFFSQHDRKTLYSAANVLFKSTDGGQSWQPISPDLTRNEKSRLGSSGGPITKDNTSVEYYSTLFAAAESRLEPGVLWVGSDDGLIHISRDGGKSWKNVTPKGIPEWIMINAIDSSPHDKGGAYVAATMYKSDDFRPYLYKTADYGATWTRMDSGIDPMHFTRVVRADPAKKGLLYAGTERGVYVSFDDGARWQPFQLNLPIVPITDLTVKDGDLVAATQGRGFWVLDGLGPVRDATANRDADARGQRKAWLMPPASAYRLPNMGWSPPRPPQGMGENPPAGVVIQYHLEEGAAGRTGEASEAGDPDAGRQARPHFPGQARRRPEEEGRAQGHGRRDQGRGGRQTRRCGPAKRQGQGRRGRKGAGRRGGAGRGRPEGAHRGRPQPLCLGHDLVPGQQVPGHDPLERRSHQPDRGAGQLPGPPHRQRRDAHAAVRDPQGPALRLHPGRPRGPAPVPTGSAGQADRDPRRHPPHPRGARPARRHAQALAPGRGHEARRGRGAGPQQKDDRSRRGPLPDQKSFLPGPAQLPDPPERQIERRRGLGLPGRLPADGPGCASEK